MLSGKLPSSAWAQALLLVCLYVALAALSPIVGGTYSPGAISLWLPIGLLYAAAITLGWRSLPGIAVGQVVSEIVLGSHPIGAALALAAGNVACGALLISWVSHVRRRTPLNDPTIAHQAEDHTRGQGVLSNPQLVLMSLIALTVGSVFNALAGAWVFKSANEPLLQFMVVFVLGDLGGALLTGALLLLAVQSTTSSWKENATPFFALLLACVIVFGSRFFFASEVPLWAFTVLIVPALVWAAARHTQAQAVLLSSMCCGLLIFHASSAASAVTASSAVPIDLLAKGYAAMLLLLTLLLSSNRVQSERASLVAHRLNQVLLRAESVARTGSWRLDLQSGQLSWSPQVYELFGLPDHKRVPDYAHFLSLVHPDDAAGLDAAWQAALAGATYDFRHRIIRNSQVVWLRERAEFEFDACGKPMMAWGTVQDISDQVALEEARSARDRAEAANVAKGTFLATISHEIRTPLNGVIGLATLAQDHTLTPAVRENYLDQLSSSAVLLNEIIGDVLDLSKIEAGQFEIAPAAFELHPLLENLAQTYRTLGQAKGLHVTLDLESGTPGYVWGDATRVRQVLNNFLSNALKFTKRGGFTLRAAQETEGVFRFEVQDSGIGLSVTDIDRIFEPFVQAKDPLAIRHTGTGLGLSICRELARLMEGTIGAHSELGQGSTFWFRVRLPVVPAERQSLANSDTGNHQGRARDLEGIRLLLADDNQVNVLVAKKMLEAAGAQVATVGDGQAALEAIKAANSTDATAFDLVLMDVHMPVMDGLMATRRIRELERVINTPRHLPIVAMTAGVLDEQKRAAMESGMDAFIAKPMSRENLVSMIIRALNGRSGST